MYAWANEYNVWANEYKLSELFFAIVWDLLNGERTIDNMSKVNINE